MKKLLAVCTTALRALGLARGGNSAPRHAHKRVRITKPLAVFTTALLATGLAVVGVASASAHTGDLNATAVCNTQTGQYDVTYTLTVSSTSLSGTTYWKTGSTTFEGTPTSNSGLSNGPVNSTGSGTYTLGVIHLPGTSVRAPWAYAFTTWTDGFKKGSDGGDITLAGNCSNTTTTEVTPAAPTFADSVCTGPGQYGDQGSYTIPSTPGVKYEIRTSQHENWGWSDWSTASAGTTSVAVGTYVEIRAVDADNNDSYTLKYKKNGWKWDEQIGHPRSSSCVVAVTAAVTFTDAICTGPGTSGTTGSYTIPNTIGVQYQIEKSYEFFGTHYYWSDVSAGTVTVNVGTTVKIRAVAENNYTISGDDGPWTHAFVSAGVCLTGVQPASVDFTEAVCTGPGTHGQASYTIPTTTGVDYKVGGSVMTAGVHYVAPGTSVTVTAVPQAGYNLTGTTSWNHDFAATGTCEITVTIETDPEVVQPQCVQGEVGVQVDSGYIKVTPTAHVTYSITGTTDSNDAVNLSNVGQYTELDPGHYTVTATADPGFVLAEGDGPWNFTISAFEGDCDLQTFGIIPTGVASTSQVCTAGEATGGSITVGQVEESDFFNAGIDYFINGVKVTAKTTTVPAGTYTVTAVPDPEGDATIEPGYDDSWTITIASPSTSCGDLKTLAFTGADGSMGGMLIIALFLLLGGAGVYTASRYRSRES